MSTSTNLADLLVRADSLDASDPLRPQADLFTLPDGMIYLDGNSLGPPPDGVAERLANTAKDEWGQSLITGWNKHGWMELSRKAGGRIARLIGAEADSVRACDSTSVNLHKVLSAALSLRPDRRVVVSERGNFPTDLYVAERLLAGLGAGYSLRLVDDAETDLAGALDDTVAVVMVTQVDYRSGRKLDMAACSRQIHDAGAIALWDLAHSAGAFKVALDADGADFAVGCGYKFLNGGPGAPAFLYVARAHHETAKPILAGWMGHAAPFDFTPDYQPAAGIDRYLVGTPSVLALTAFEAALAVFDNVTTDQIEAKTRSLSGMFITAVETLCDGLGLTLASPKQDARRGAQVSFHHPDGYAVMQALIARGVVGDFRAPDIVRFGFSPLYLSHRDVVNAADILADILRTGSWDRPEFKARSAVT